MFHKLGSTSLGLMVAAGFLFATLASAQYTGFNGAGWFENTTPQAEQWIAELNQPFTLRVPGGAIAKFADPYTNTKGWGLTYAGIDSILALYGNTDEEGTGDATQKWHRKADAQPNYSYLDELIKYSASNPGLRVIWVANIYIDPQITVNIIDYLKLGGVNVVCVELGNESYSQVNHDINRYKSKALPVRSAIKQRWATMPVSHPAAAATAIRENNKNRQWNQALNAILFGDWVTFHPYYDGREFPALIDPINYQDALLQIANYNFDFEAIKAKFPNAGNFIVTEGNTQPARLIGNTFLNAIFMYRYIAEGKKAFEYFCPHNGIAPDVYGIIYGTPPQRNTWYYSYKAATGENSFFTLDGSIDRPADFYTAENLTDAQLIHSTGALVPPVSFGNYLEGSPGDADTVCHTEHIPKVIYKDSAGTVLALKVDYIPRTDTTQATTSDTLFYCDQHILIDVFTFPVYTPGIDTVETIYLKDTTYKVPVIVYDTLTVCDTIPGTPGDTITPPPAMQPLDADTLLFNNETEFRDFLKYYGIADYDILPQNFDANIRVEDALPYKYLVNNAGHTVWCIDFTYYKIYAANGVEINEAQHYLNDVLFKDKRAVIIFDHSGLAKSDREFRPEYCPAVDYRNCDLHIVSPFTGQVAVFTNVFYWADRNGGSVFNTNLKAWLLWGTAIPEKTYSFEVRIWDKETGCDLSYRDYNPDHQTAELRFGQMAITYGNLLIK